MKNQNIMFTRSVPKMSKARLFRSVLALGVVALIIMVIAGLVVAPSPAQCSPPPINERQYYVTTADGVSIFVREKSITNGNKIPVLLVHGTWANSQTWDFPGRSVMDYLALRGYDAYALDMRGMGMSTRPANYLD